MSGAAPPGVLSAQQLNRVLDACRTAFPDFTPDHEVAVEFDPGCVDEQKLKDIYEHGFNRFSMGVQSFDEGILKENNRPHNLAEVYTAWEAVKKSGFSHTNIDLIYPLIGLDIDTWIESVKEAIRLETRLYHCLSIRGLEEHRLSPLAHEEQETTAGGAG